MAAFSNCATPLAFVKDVFPAPVYEPACRSGSAASASTNASSMSCISDVEEQPWSPERAPPGSLPEAYYVPSLSSTCLLGREAFFSNPQALKETKQCNFAPPTKYLPDAAPAPVKRVVAPVTPELKPCNITAPAFRIKNTFIDDIIRDEEAELPMGKTKTCPARMYQDLSDAGDEESMSTIDERPAFEIEPIEVRRPSMSIGSMGHGLQGVTCKPCGWYWRPLGCVNGKGCRHCHQCSASEAKVWKKKAMKTKKALAYRQQKQAFGAW